jgi:hypothetical protein
MRAEQEGQLQKNWQASVGIVSRVDAPHEGQVSVLWSCTIPEV